MGSVSMCRDEVKASLHIFHTRLVSFLVLKVDAFGAPFSAGRHHPPQRCYPGPPNFMGATRWWFRCGARSPGAYVPGTAGVCGSMVADHTGNSDSWREPPRGIRR